jgi:cytochrome oxidase assembly protein ShyY1
MREASTALLELPGETAEASSRRTRLRLGHRQPSPIGTNRSQTWPRAYPPWYFIRCSSVLLYFRALTWSFAAIIPITAFALGTWQVQRLGWKTTLIAKLEDRILREPLPLPPHIDPDAIGDFDYRRVTATGRYRHDQEMLIGPRMRDGKQGYMVVTPLEREGDGTTVLVNRGWISKAFQDQRSRPGGLPEQVVLVEGLLRQPWKKNMFTPDNRPDKGEFYFPDVKEMAELTGSQPVWVEATMGASKLFAYTASLCLLVRALIPRRTRVPSSDGL